MHLFSKTTPAMPPTVRFTTGRVRFSLLALALAASLGAASLPARAEEPRVAIAGNLAPAAALRQAHLLGRLASSTAMQVGLMLPLRHQSELDDLVRRQYLPGDALYHQFLTPPEFTVRFGPTQEDYDAVAAYARAQGLTVTGTSPGRTLLNVAGPSARMEAAFGVQFNRYRLIGGREVFASRAAPRLPRSVAARLTGIAGLNNAALMRPMLSRMRPQHDVSASQSVLRGNAPIPITGGGGSGSGPLGGLSPNDIKYAYSLDSLTPLYGTTVAAPAGALTGSGQNIGLFELDGFAAGDIAQYVSTFALPTVLTGATASVTPILLDNFKGTPVSVEGQTEVTLDIDMILALAPAATGIYVYEDDQTALTYSPVTLFTRMANDVNPNGSNKPLLSVISCSWGIPESLEDPAVIQGENAVFQQMAAQGQSLFCASGDLGAYDLYTAPTTTGTTTTGSGLTSPEVDNPASQPYATGVGGTTLSYVKPGADAVTGVATPGVYVSETAWSAGTPAVSPEGSGGGVSGLWSKPSYQMGIGSSPTRREVPDVALNADPNTAYSIFVGSTTATAGGTAEVVGGTSAAAPLWAAYTLLINEQRATNGLGSVGFLNPLIYPIGAGTSYSADFHDISSGSNLFYQAGTGYDDATGYGSFIGAPLLAALSFNPNQGTGTATISGLVSDGSTPPVLIVGAAVSAVSTAAGAVVATAITDATGAYTLTVPSGLALKLTVDTSTVTAPTGVSFTGTSLSEPALTAGDTVTLPFILTTANVYPVGLQMISAPYDYTGIGDFAAAFGLTVAQASIAPRLVQYSSTLNSYIFYPTAPADTLRLGQGYWVRFPSPNYLHIAGTPASTAAPFSIPLSPGWNQIGDPFFLPVPLTSITVSNSAGTASGPFTSTPVVVQPTVYSYNTSTNAYVLLSDATDPLQPYAGYWVYALQNSTLSVPYPGAPPPAP